MSNTPTSTSPCPICLSDLRLRLFIGDFFLSFDPGGPIGCIGFGEAAQRRIGPHVAVLEEHLNLVLPRQSMDDPVPAELGDINTDDRAFGEQLRFEVQNERLAGAEVGELARLSALTLPAALVAPRQDAMGLGARARHRSRWTTRRPRRCWR